MFEALLEKILLSHFGRFLSGLDRTNIHLGVWSGNLIIENVGLKPEVIEMLELPLHLRFSHIEKFQVNVPWSKISQQSVEIFIQNVFVIVTQKSRNDWKLEFYKHELIEQFLRKTLEEFLINKAKIIAGKDNNSTNVSIANNNNNNNNMLISVDKQGIFDRLIAKIIDNIQIVIQNIHVRYENDLEKPGFCWGFTLSDLRIFTTESQYKSQIFFDRSDPKNRDVFLYKKAELTKLGLYWNSNDLQFFSSLNSNEIKAKMYNFSLYEHEEQLMNANKNYYSKRIDYIVSINCDLKAMININNPTNNTNSPEVQLSLNLKTLNFLIRNSQLQDFIRMLEYFQQYQGAFTREKAKNRKKVQTPKLPYNSDKKVYWREYWKYIMNKAMVSDMKNRFDGLFQKILKKKGGVPCFSEAKELSKLFNWHELQRFNKIISEIEVDELFKWVKEAFYREELGKLILKQKKFVSAVFCGNSSKKNLKKQNAYLRSLLESNEYNYIKDYGVVLSNQELEGGYILKTFLFELEELNIRLTKKLKKYDEGLIFRLKSLKIASEMLIKGGFELKAWIREISIDLINNNETKNEIVIPILKRNSELVKKQAYFLVLTLKRQQRSMDTTLELGSLEIVYYPSIMLKLQAYFSVQSNEEGVRNLAIDEYRYLQSSATKQLAMASEQSLDFSIKIKIQSPTLIIPFLQYNDLASPCFVLLLGDIEFNNEDKHILGLGVTMRKDDNYEKFLLKSNPIKLFFYSSINFFNLTKKYGEMTAMPAFLTEVNNRNEKFQIIENLELRAHIQRIKAFSRERASMRIMVVFQPVTLNFSQKTFSDLMNFKKFFNNPDFRTQELLQTEMKPLFDHAFRKGMLKKKENTFKNWSNYYVVFNGGYLYFFLSPKDVKYSGYLYIKDSVVKECASEIGVTFSFKVTNKFQDSFFACRDQNDLKSWVKILNKKIHEFSFKTYQFSVIGNRKSEGVAKTPDYNLTTLNLHARIPLLQLNFIDLLSQKPALQFSFNSIDLNVTQSLLDLKSSLTMESFKIDDFLSEKPDFPLLTTRSQQSKNCLDFSLNILEKNNPAYKNSDCDAELSLSKITIYWKYRSFAYLMRFLMQEPEFNLENLTENSNKTTYKQRSTMLLDSSPRLRQEKSLKEFTKKLTWKREELLEDNIENNSKSQILSETRVFSLKLEIISSEINCIVKNINIALLKTPEVAISVNIKSDNTMEIQGKILDILIYDLTNFPETKLFEQEVLFSNKNPHIYQKEMLLPGNSIEFSFLGFDPNSPKISNNIFSRLKCEIKGLKIVYFQQAFLRIIDFLIDDITGTLTFDYKTPELLKEDPRFLVFLLKRPRFSSLEIKLQDCELYLKSKVFESREIRLSIREVKIENFQEKSNGRLKEKETLNLIIGNNTGNVKELSEGIWLDNYAIGFFDIALQFKDSGDEKSSFLITNNSRLYNGSILIERLYMGDEINKVLKEIFDVDKTMKVLMFFEAFELKFNYQAYQYFLKVLMNNLAFDDSFEAFFLKKPMAKIDRTPISLFLDFPIFKLTLETPFEEIAKSLDLSFLPMTEIAFLQNRFTYNRDSQGKSLITLDSLDFLAEDFDYRDDGHESFKVIVTNFLRIIKIEVFSLAMFMKTRRNHGFSLERNIKMRAFTQISSFNSEKLAIELRNRVFNHGRARFSLKMETGKDIEKKLELIANNTMFLFNARLLSNLLEYIKPKDETSRFYENLNFDKKLEIVLELRNFLVCFQSSNEENILAMQARVILNYRKNLDLFIETHESLHSEIAEGGFIRKTSSHFETAKIIANLAKIEVFTCNKSDVFDEKPEDYDVWKLDIKKRALTQPFGLKVLLKSVNCGCNRGKYWSFDEIAVSVSNSMRANVSYKDFLLIYESLEFQREETLNQGKSHEKMKFMLTNEEKNSETGSEENNQDIEDNLSVNSEEKARIPMETGEKPWKTQARSCLEVDIERIELILIDDIGKTLIPILQIIFAIKSLNSEKIFNKRISKGVFSLCLCYYNPVSGKLEPIIESINLLFGFIESQQSSPEKYLTLELENAQKSLNLNISEEMISGLLKTYYSLTRELEVFRNEKASNNERNLPYQGKLLRKNTFSKKYYQDYMKYVSIYSITNETGYDLELIRDESQLKYALNLQKTFNLGLSSRNTLDQKLSINKMVMNSYTENFDIHSDEIEYEKTFHKSHNISVKFMTFSGSEAEIRNIELNRIRTKRYYWNIGLFKGFFIAEIKTIGSRKNLKLTSQGIFKNFIDNTLICAIKSPRFKTLFIEIEKGQEKACPCEFFEEMGSFQIKLALGNRDYYNASVKNIEKNEFSTPILDFKSLKEEILEKNEVFKEIAHHPHFSLIKVEKQGEFLEKLVFSINPWLKIVNCLPISLELFSEVSNLPRKMRPQEEFQDLSIKPFSRSRIWLKLPGFEASKALEINPNDYNSELSTQILSLKSSNSEVLSNEDSLIFIGRKTRISKGLGLYIYAKACVINQTYQLLDFWTFDKGMNKKTKIRGFPGSEGFSMGNIAILGLQEKLMIGFKGDINETSNEVDIRENGDFSVELKSRDEEKCRLYEFGVSIKKKAVHDLEIYTKTIEISHRYVLLNKTSFPLEISQSRAISPLILMPFERSPFNWSDCTKDKSIIVRIHQNPQSSIENQWVFSGPIDITSSRSLSFILTRETGLFANPHYNQQDADGLDALFIKLDIVKVQTTFFLSFLAMNQDNYSYILRNDTLNFLIKYRQNLLDLDSPELVLLKETSRPFAWTFPDSKPELEVSFLHLSEQLVPQKYVFNLDTIIETRDLTLSIKNPENISGKVHLKVRTVIHGPTRVLQFYEPSLEELQNNSFEMSEIMVANKHRRLSSMLIARKKCKIPGISQKEKAENLLRIYHGNNENDEVKEENIEKSKDFMKMLVLINFAEMGFSIIARNSEKSLVELAFIHIKGLEFLLMEERTFKTIQMRTKFVNIDNNSDYKTLIPVVFTPSLKRGLLEDKSQYFFDIFVKYNHTSKEILWFDSIRLEVQSATVKIDEDFANLLLNYLETVNNIFNGYEEDGETQRKKPINSIDLLFLPIEDFASRSLTMKLIKKGIGVVSLPEITTPHEILIFFDQNNKNPYADWEWLEIPETNRYIYIKELVVPPLDFYLSFSRRISTSQSETSIERLASALSKAFANIDEAPIHLKGFKLNFIFDTKSGIIEKITEHYKTSIVSTVLKVIGSINILGNPIGLYNYMKSGFIELIERPRKGLVHGPLEAGLGAIIGAGCLLKQTFAGTFNSLHHISNSLATGLTVLTFDDSFIENRRKFKLKKPHNVLEGVDQGLRSIYSGLEKGVTGLFIKPYEGVKSDGFTGLLKGTATGVSGLLLKPVTGICEATSKTAEGLKNTTIHFDDKPNDERIRFPRVFYESEKYIKKYEKLDAEVLQLLQEVEKGRFANNTFFEAFAINMKKDASCVFVVTIEDLLCYSRKRRKFYWKVRTKDVEKVERKVIDEENEEVKIRIWLNKTDKYGKLVEMKVDEKAERAEKCNRKVFESVEKVVEIVKLEEMEFLE